MKIQLRITPQNEGHDLNYTEILECQPTDLARYFSRMIEHLQLAMKEGTFSIKFETIPIRHIAGINIIVADTKTWYYKEGRFYTAEWKEIKTKNINLYLNLATNTAPKH